jgi:hypothetical protein
MSQNEMPTKSSCFNTDEEAKAGVLDNPNNTLLARAAFPRDHIEFNFMMSLPIRFLHSEKYRTSKVLPVVGTSQGISSFSAFDPTWSVNPSPQQLSLCLESGQKAYAQRVRA